MDAFLSAAKNNEVIGVHCTHGLNRTGYLVCRYLVQQLGWNLDDAIKAFEAARGHPIERKEYIQSLRGVQCGSKIDTTTADSEKQSNSQWRNDARQSNSQWRNDARQSNRQWRNDACTSANWRAESKRSACGPWMSHQRFNDRHDTEMRQFPPPECPPAPRHPPLLRPNKEMRPPGTSIPPPLIPSYPPGPNAFRMPRSPSRPPAPHSLPPPHFPSHTPCPPRIPVFPPPRPLINKSRPPYPPRPYGNSFINRSDSFHTRSPFVRGAGGPVPRPSDYDFKSDAYESNLCNSKPSASYQGKRPGRFTDKC